MDSIIPFGNRRQGRRVIAPRKRRTDEIVDLREPDLSPPGREHLRRGVLLFNSGSYWHAHEEWESAWLMMPEGEGGDAEIILRGLIQLAAALHLEGIGREDGAASNFRKSEEKLALAPGHFMGLDLAALRSGVLRYRSGDAPRNPPRIVLLGS